MIENAVGAHSEAPLRNVPDVNEVYFGVGGSLHTFDGLADPRVFRVHAPFDPRLPRVVYLVRDPRDVLVSYWHFRRMMTPSFDQSLTKFLSSRHRWPCHWDVHVEGWLLRRRRLSNLLVLRYEDVMRQPVSALHSVLHFLRMPRGTPEIERAIEMSQFEQMRVNEDAFVVSSRKARTDERFVRRAQPGAWREELDGESVALIEHRYGRVMRALGYETVNRG